MNIPQELSNKTLFGTGFPKNALPKVMAKLEREKINYLIIDTRNNYDVDEKNDNNNLNRYDLLELSYEANSIEDIEEKKKILRKMIAKIKIVNDQ